MTGAEGSPESGGGLAARQRWRIGRSRRGARPCPLPRWPENEKTRQVALAGGRLNASGYFRDCSFARITPSQYLPSVPKPSACM